MALEVGIHDIAADAYHADPCEEISLSRSGIVTLLNETPAVYASRNPRLTRWPELLKRDGTDSTDLGEVVHATVLGGLGGCKFIVGDPSEHFNKKGEPYSTWSGEAKAWKDQQKANGYIVINRETNARALQISAVLTAAIEKRFGKKEWADREVEQTLIWQRRLNDGSMIWCRARRDAVLPDGTTLEIKTTALSLSDVELGKRIAADGLDVQHCWYSDGDEKLSGASSRFVFPWVLTVPPYTVRFVDLEAIEWPLSLTRMRIDMVAQRFGECVRSNEWPDAPLDATPIPPSWWISMCEKQLGIDAEIVTE